MGNTIMFIILAVFIIASALMCVEPTGLGFIPGCGWLRGVALTPPMCVWGVVEGAGGGTAGPAAGAAPPPTIA